MFTPENFKHIRKYWPQLLIKTIALAAFAYAVLVAGSLLACAFGGGR